MKVLCISGKAQSGKDTAASIFQDRFTKAGKKAIILHYADLLKFLCKQLFGWDGKKDERGRTLLQYVGTDIIRAKDPCFWVRYVKQILDFFGDHWDYVIIPDCRFPNEIDYLKSAQYKVIHIRVVRPVCTESLTAEQQKHTSETALDDVTPDIFLLNENTIQDLERAIDSLIHTALPYLPITQTL